MSSSLRKAERLFETFHAFEPIDVGEFHPRFRVPRSAALVGDAKVMYYRSDKLNPETHADEGWIHYYHDHKDGVRTYLTKEVLGKDYLAADIRRVPRWIYQTSALVRIGDCEGLDYEDHDGELREIRRTGRAPEWYCVPSGKALLIVQDKKTVLGIVWGGKLRVEDRGVVG